MDLCDLLSQPKPAAADPEGAWYCFERGVSKSEGGQGWADVWMKDHFGWEYKGKRKDLKAAYAQLCLYRESLDNPPLLIVCDLNRFEIHTNFTGTAKKIYAFDLAGLADPKNLDIFRRVFTDPESLRPGVTSQSVTEQAAEHFGRLADGLRSRGIVPEDAAHFLMKLMFCMFAEDIDLLPKKVFSRTLAQAKKGTAKLSAFLRDLFHAMAHGGTFALEEILYFNGGLFADSTTIDLTPDEIQTLAQAAEFDWSAVEPHIFGTLFERTLDPAKRSQIGAHYTSSDDIRTLLEPVMMTPLRREWQAVREKCEALIPKLAAEAKKQTVRATKESKPRREFNKLLRDFVERLAHVTVLDPACGSGNFLYVGLRLLLDLEKEVITFAASHKLGLLPQVRPTQLHGIEINPFAQELAQVVIWIGYLQWMRDNGFSPPRNPVLEPIESIENRDAILDLTEPAKPKEPAWQPAEFIVGNPPFLGAKKLRDGLKHDYVDALFQLYGSRIPNFSDLCCYWFEKAREQIVRNKTQRAGLLATQGIRGGANREVLKRIEESGNIFFAESSRLWVLDGANVHVSMVGFDDGTERSNTLDGRTVERINANLTTETDITSVKKLPASQGLCFYADVKAGKFDLPFAEAFELLKVPNPNTRPNSDVVLPWANGRNVTQRAPEIWIIDFGVDTPIEVAAGYEKPFKVVQERVYPERSKVNRKRYRNLWWLHAEPCGQMRRRISPLDRFIATVAVAKHRLFVWMRAPTLPDHQVMAIASDDDFHFGVLHSRVHEHWALQLGTRLETRPRYTPTTCFETFPFPEPTEKQRTAIADAARELDRLRNNWLNPPEWTQTETLTFPGSADGPWARYVHDPNTRGVGTVRYPRIVPKDDECAKELKKRTLTNLYNQRPAWLDLAHKKLDAAVFAAYGWLDTLSDDDLLAKLLELNLSREQQ